MTIASQTSRISYNGDGVTTAFAVPFYFQVNADIVVYLQDTLGNQTLQLLGTNYNLTGATVSTGGTCTFVTAPVSGYTISIYRDPPLTQTTSYNNNDPFPAKSHELALDKGVTIDQRTRDMVNRTIHLPDGDPNISAVLASVAIRKSKLLGFDNTGAVIYPLGPTFVNGIFTSTAMMDSRASIAVTSFAGSVNFILAGGYTTPGDCVPIPYRRVGSQPAHIFKVQSADGTWWEVNHQGKLDLRWGGAGLGVTATDDAAMASAITLGSGSGASAVAIDIYLGYGSYTFAGQYTLDRSNARITGAGIGLTTINMAPTATQTLFKFHDTAATAGGGTRDCWISGCTVQSSDTTFIKIFADIQNSDITTVEDIFIVNLVDTSKSSIGIAYRGRNFFRPRRLRIGANYPLVLLPNPDRAAYTAHIDSDLMHAQDLDLTVSPISPTHLGNGILINPGCNITRMRLVNTSVQGGGHAFSWSETGTADQASYDIVIDGLYTEQMQSATTSSIFIDFTSSANTLRGVKLRNLNLAGEGKAVTILGGGSVRVESVDIDSMEYTGAGTIFQIDAGIRDFRWKGLDAPLASASASLSTQVLREGQYWESGCALPSCGSLARSSRDEVIWRGADAGNSRIGTYVRTQTIANAGVFALTPFSDFTVLSAIITVGGGAEAGSARFSAGAALASIGGTANFAIAAGGGKLAIVRVSDTNVQISNNLGVGTTAMIKVEFVALPNP